jgi:hypothetical protein
MNIKQAEKWMKSVFAGDILKESDGEFIKGYIRLMPSMNSSCFALVYNYYTDEAKEPGDPGTIEKAYTYLPNLARRFSEVISAGKSVEDNIKAMIDSILIANNGKNDVLVAYLNLCLDRLKYPNFVDIRTIFHELCKKYDAAFDRERGINNRASVLKEISAACQKFENFIAKQEEKAEAEGGEYVKEFFDGK